MTLEAALELLRAAMAEYAIHDDHGYRLVLRTIPGQTIESQWACHVLDRKDYPFIQETDLSPVHAVKKAAVKWLECSRTAGPTARERLEEWVR